MFRPHVYLKSVLDLQPEWLRTLGITGLLLDVDCTLKDHRATEIPSEVRCWINALKDLGVRMCLVSNGRSKRIARLANALDVPFVALALKPLPFGCYRAIKKLALPPDQVAMVGDQVFADVLAGRLAGLRTILVRPTTTDEPWFTRMKRPLERCVLVGVDFDVSCVPGDKAPAVS